MRTVVEASAGLSVDTTDGIRVLDPDRGWVLVLPDPAEAVTHLWAEGADADTAQALLDEWAVVVDRADTLGAPRGSRRRPWEGH